MLGIAEVHGEDRAVEMEGNQEGKKGWEGQRTGPVEVDATEGGEEVVGEGAGGGAVVIPVLVSLASAAVWSGFGLLVYCVSLRFLFCRLFVYPSLVA